MDQHLMRILNDSTDAKRLLCEQSKCEEREKKYNDSEMSVTESR